MKRYVTTQERLGKRLFWGVWDNQEKKLMTLRFPLKQTQEEAQTDADLLNGNKVVAFPNLLLR